MASEEPTTRKRLLRRHAGVALVRVPLILCVVACSAYTIGSQWYLVPWARLQVQTIGENCGTITEGANGAGLGELCLWNAYTACRSAALVGKYERSALESESLAPEDVSE